MTDRPQFACSQWAWRVGIGAIFRDTMRYVIQSKRWKKKNGELTSTGRKLLIALEEYAESNGISTDRDDWFEEAMDILGSDMLSVVLPMLPPIRLDGMDPDESSLQQWAHDLRRLMNREATIELIGPDTKPASRAPQTADEERRALLEIDFALNSPRLTPEDRQAIITLRQTGADEIEAAQALGWSASTFRKRMERIRKKLA